jgi:hypothetical protein
MKKFFTIFLLLAIVWFLSKLILVDRPENLAGTKLYEGVVYSLECGYLSRKNRSYYFLVTTDKKEINITLPRHKCDEELMAWAKNRSVKVYFLGDTSLEVAIESKIIKSFDKSRSENNSLFIMLSAACLLFLFLTYFNKKSIETRRKSRVKVLDP